jgi:glycosyltransferase involved in cell wall biosynthesis
LRALHSAGWLSRFHTTISAPPHRHLHWLPAPMRGQMLRRRFDEVPSRLIHSSPARELARLTGTALGLRQLTTGDGWASVDSVYRAFDRSVATALRRLDAVDRPGVVYAYEDAAEATFVTARRNGIGRVYELPIAYFETTQRLLNEEAARLPEWRQTMGGLEDSPAKLDRKVRELELADVVVVPSRFVLDSLPPAVRASKPCMLAPFGSHLPYRGEISDRTVAGPLRILFAGAMTQRKGLADVFAAMRLLNRSDVQLVVMGSLQAPMEFYRKQWDGFVYEAPRPHGEVLALMRTCDLLVLPSIVEGRALVQQEALASGLPLLVTPNSGGDDLVDEGRTGFVVPIRSPEVLAQRIAWFADHREGLPAMRQYALAKAASTGWLEYEAHVRAAVMLAAEQAGATMPAGFEAA